MCLEGTSYVEADRGLRSEEYGYTACEGLPALWDLREHPVGRAKEFTS